MTFKGDEYKMISMFLFYYQQKSWKIWSKDLNNVAFDFKSCNNEIVENIFLQINSES